MKKYITIILLVLFTFLSATQVLAKNVVQINENQTQTTTGDQRVEILQSYLEKYNSPLAPEAINFVEAADKYNIDWKFVAAIAGNESTFGKHTPAPASHNAWGWGVYGTQAIYFKSWKDGIYTVSEGLRMHYYNKGLTNTYAIARVYAASPVWAAHVTYFLNDMDKFEVAFNEKQNKTTAPELKDQTAGASGKLALKS